MQDFNILGLSFVGIIMLIRGSPSISYFTLYEFFIKPLAIDALISLSSIAFFNAVICLLLSISAFKVA